MLKQKIHSELENGVSVVIVTYNGKDRLKPTLKHLGNQKNVSFNFEIIVVDNNSNDGTSELVYSYWEELKRPFKLRVVNEEKPGTMHARKRGIEEAQYRYVLYCDDDNWFCQDYVNTAYLIIVSNSKIAAVGGKGIIEYEPNFTPPLWMSNYERNFGTGAQGKKDGDTSLDKGCLYTAGAIFDMNWLNRLYNLGFESALKGRDAKSLVAGEDTELTYALRIIGGKLYYSSKMTFRHYMPAGRINWIYLKRLWYAFGVADYIISPYNNYLSKKHSKSKFTILIQTIFSVFKLRLKLLAKHSKEGDRDKLLYEMRKGYLSAIMNKNNERLKAVKVLSILKN